MIFSRWQILADDPQSVCFPGGCVSSRLFMLLSPLCSGEAQLFTSGHYWVDKMDHVVSSLILCVLSLGPSQASSPALPGNLPCDIWLPALRRKVKVEAGGGGPRCTFNGDAEKQRAAAAPGLHPLQRVRVPAPSGRSTPRMWGGRRTR